MNSGGRSSANKFVLHNAGSFMPNELCSADLCKAAHACAKAARLVDTLEAADWFGAAAAKHEIVYALLGWPFLRHGWRNDLARYGF